MKVLFATIPQPKNRFVIDLKEGIEQDAEVVWDHQIFWKCEGQFDIVHIHEPEYLSHEIEALEYTSDIFPPDLWDKLETCLKYWSNCAKIVTTRHVQEPHVRKDIEFQKLYSLVFSYCSGVAHFANYSIGQFKALYPGLNHIQHQVIPHHNYASLPIEVDRNQARKKLNIHPEARVMLVFGFVKEHEKKLIQDAFDAIPGDNKVLLAPGWKILRPKIKWIRLREWVFKYKKWKASLNKQYRIDLGFIADTDAQFYCMAADFLLTPRIYELNSGNITFGFSFGMVVIGKDNADIGEILKETGNPVFNVNSPGSVKRAVTQALLLADQGYGKTNKELALREWGIDKIGLQYLQLYKSVFQK